MGAHEAGPEPGRAKAPLTVLAGPYGHPFHPLLVTVPIGAWVASLVLDLGSRWGARADALSLGARWLVGVGVIGALAAAVVGFLDLVAIPSRTRARRVAVLHLTLALTATAAFAVSFALRSGDGPTAWGQVALSVLALALLAGAGWLGGMLTYRYGVRVAEERTQRLGFDPD